MGIWDGAFAWSLLDGLWITAAEGLRLSFLRKLVLVGQWHSLQALRSHRPPEELSQRGTARAAGSHCQI